MGGVSADYSSLIDTETWAFIRETDSWYPPDTATKSVAEQREIYDRMCRAFFQGYPDGIAATALSAGGVPARLYEAGQPTATVVYCHGGGFVVGGLESHDDVCAEICAQTGFRVLAVDYRLAPEHKHPAAFADAFAATQWACEGFAGDPVVLAGDSAGGNLAASVAHHARGRLTGIVGQVLIYPGLGGPHDQGSYLTHANAPMLTAQDIAFYRMVRVAGEEPQGDPTYAPLHDKDFTGLPPTLIVTAECDPLCDDGGLYRDQIVAAGGQAHWITEPGLVHGYLRARSTVTRARDSFARIKNGIEALAQGLWPYG